MQRAREVFYLYALQNVVTVVLCFAIGRHSLAGLTASVSIAYSAAALVALGALARPQVNLAPALWSRHVRRSLWASLLATVVMAIAYATPSWTGGALLVGRFSLAVGLGVLTYGATVLLLQRRLSRTPPKDARLKQF